MIKINFTWDLAVGNHGAGIVVKNTARSTMTLKRENDAKLPKIITMACVVVKNQDSKKKSIVRADNQDIVVVGGKQAILSKSSL